MTEALPTRSTLWIGILFSLSWFIGLSIWSADTQVSQSAGALLAIYSGHETIGLVQFFFTEGLPPLCFGFVMWRFSQFMKARQQARLAKFSLWMSNAAAAISLIQFSVGAYLCLHWVPTQNATAVKSAIDFISRADGLKMLCMTAFATAGFLFLRREKHALPQWFQWIALTLALSIFISALGFLLLVDSLSLAAYISLPLLLIWITGLGIYLSKLRLNS